MLAADAGIVNFIETGRNKILIQKFQGGIVPLHAMSHGKIPIDPQMVHVKTGAMSFGARNVHNFFDAEELEFSGLDGCLRKGLAVDHEVDIVQRRQRGMTVAQYKTKLIAKRLDFGIILPVMFVDVEEELNDHVRVMRLPVFGKLPAVGVEIFPSVHRYE